MTCTLKKPLKKSEQWVLQLTNMFINKSPTINLDKEAQLEIHSLSGQPLATHFSASDLIFIPQNTYTVCEYVTQLQRFFSKFSYRFWRVGRNGSSIYRSTASKYSYELFETQLRVHGRESSSNFVRR